MNYSDFAKRIAAVGRALTPEAVTATRAVIEPLVPVHQLDHLHIVRDLAYGDDPRHRLDIFTAPNQQDLKPALLFVHGGGFIAGDKHAEGSPFFSNIGAWAVQNGFAGINMTYRLAPMHQWPSGIEDIRHAIAFIQARGAEYGVDASRLFLLGQSAGAAHGAGYLAHPEVYGATLKKPAHGLKGAIFLSGVYDFDSMPTTDKETAYLGEDESLYHDRSSLDNLMKVNLPMLFTMAEYDPPPFQAQTLQLLNAWWESGQHEETLPWFVYLLGQNHMSPVMYLGLEGDQLGPQLKRFMAEHC